MDEAGNPLEKYRSIGIILAGGGAKGAYQAGALKAIHKFLRRHGALPKVKMIAGTSIGAWNAMFWLADRMEEGIEEWWAGISLFSLFRCEAYLPGLQNHLFTTKPWQRAFDRLFKDDPQIAARLQCHLDSPDAEGSIHFYFTRSNVGRARLEVTANHDFGKAAPNLPGSGSKGVHRVDRQLARGIDDLRTAVFSSMNLPPLFEYIKIGDNYYEDGGVIDNLPIQFGTEAEHCDLLFILPLNATFSGEVNRRSVWKRMGRVMDVRQGVLERNSFKMVYLYNELSALRDKVEDYEALLQRVAGRVPANADGEVEQLLDEIANIEKIRSAARSVDESTNAERALSRRHGQVQVFAICPAPKLAIDTMQFWKRKAAAEALRLMERAAGEELEKFFASPPNLIRMALVQPQGDVTYLEDF